jgi:hypothetical protein
VDAPIEARGRGPGLGSVRREQWRTGRRRSRVAMRGRGGRRVSGGAGGDAGDDAAEGIGEDGGVRALSGKTRGVFCKMSAATSFT